MKLFKILKKTRVVILLVFIIISVLAINPQFGAQGVAIKNVAKNSTAEFAGIVNPSAETSPTTLEKIKEINGETITNLEQYSSIIESLAENSKITITTNKDTYILLKSNDFGLEVEDVSTSNIRKGLDLQGGTRVLLKPETEISEQERTELIDTMRYRLDTYGLKDIEIRKTNDLLGNKYILVELAGATKQEVTELIASQGSFEARIGDETVFSGGKQDITFVCRNDGSCAGIRDCSKTQDGYYCKFQFQIKLTQESAERHAAATDELTINLTQSGQEMLSKTIDFYLDDTLVDSLQISADLKGQVATDIIISGPGTGNTEQEAIQNALKSMNKLQTILITGSFPHKLEIVKLDSISPLLGGEFMKNAIITGLLAILAVALVIFIRYRKLKIAIPLVLTSIFEVIIILGISALFKRQLDLAAIAGIIAAVGTGVDHQIVIIDETLSRITEQFYSWKQRIKRALFIIMAAYFTTLFAMMPLLFAGAGLLKGFAFTTILGITVGVFLTRPAFAAIIETLTEE